MSEWREVEGNPEGCDSILSSTETWSIYKTGTLSERLRKIADFLDHDPRFVLVALIYEYSEDADLADVMDEVHIIKAQFDQVVSA